MRTTPARLAALLAAALLVAACGDDDPSSPAGIPPLTWTWIPVAGAVCSDGSPTGIGIETPAAPSEDVLVFLMGGGACWDAFTCFPQSFGLPIPQLATPGPYGAPQLQADIPELVPGSIFDRSVAENPYKDFTFVFVPYCTGDVHSGDTVQSYPLAPRAWHHRGSANLAADFAWLADSLAAPSRVVIAGSSAGGFGSLLAFDLARTTWPGARGYLVDDSGPPLREIPDTTVAAWYAAWDLGAAVTPLCGLECATDLSLAFPALQAKYPDDRLALLSSTEDEVIRGFFGTFSTAFPYVISMSPAEFEAGLRALATRIEDDLPIGETHAFVVPGTSHTMLGDPGAFTSEGTNLFEWLSLQVNDDPAWSSAVPPPAP